MIRKFTYLSIIILTVYSCDCLQHVQGYIVDSSTLKPIDSVVVSRFYIEPSDLRFTNNIYTDSLGHFEFKAISGGLFRCPKVELYFIRPGYELCRKKYPSCCTDNDKIRLKRID